ncbi:MAG: single-stranded DNA-binding protein [Thauera sp.]|jgi:single-strand DNA-binding protein|nr:single-stranded DNA-binding protein [Thauera sp.]
MNSWSFIGRLGRDAELRHTQSGEQVLTFSVAVDVGYGDRKTTLWPRCSMWGKRGQAVANYLNKGTQVGVVGELSTNEHNGKTYLEVRVNDLTLVGGKGDSQQGQGQTNSQTNSQPQQAQQPRQAQQNQPAPNNFDSFDDDVPF